MSAIWLALGIILGLYLDKVLLSWVVFICVIVAAFKITRAQIKEEEQEEIEAGKHSFYYGYKFKK